MLALLLRLAGCKKQKERAEKRPSQYLRFKSIFAIRALTLNCLGTNNKRRGGLKKKQNQPALFRFSFV
jgi:hypothetical protein